MASARRWIEPASTSIGMGPQSGFPKTYPNTEKISGPVMWRASAADTTDHTRMRKAMAATADGHYSQTRRLSNRVSAVPGRRRQHGRDGEPCHRAVGMTRRAGVFIPAPTHAPFLMPPRQQRRHVLV